MLERIYNSIDRPTPLVFGMPFEDDLRSIVVNATEPFTGSVASRFLKDEE
jgi:hypothetical protein